jgi:hypothetical protein
MTIRHEIVRARHTGYTASGIPIVTEKQSDICLTSPVPYPEARHIKYGTTGMRIVACVTRCCEWLTDERVDEGCRPGGIAPKILAVAQNVSNCLSAQLRKVVLDYELGTGTAEFTGTGTGIKLPGWTGTLSGLRGGSLELEFQCIPALSPFDPPTYRLYYRGCDSGAVDAPSICEDPLIIPFQLTINHCCDCLNSDETGDISITIYANCHRIVWGRHIDYVMSGPAKGKAIVATDSCPAPGEKAGCDVQHCGLVAEIANCGCLAGAWDLAHIGGAWVGDVGTGCTVSPTQVQFFCYPHTGASGTGTGIAIDRRYVTVQVNVICGTDNTGTDTQIIPAEDMEDLDVIFNVNMTWTGSDCGTATWQYNEMAGTWSEIGNNCRGDCSSIMPTTPGTDGEIRETACGIGGVPSEVPCCVGIVPVRIVR